jgi:hypothetical protein
MKRLIDVSQFEHNVRLSTLRHYKYLPEYAKVHFSIEDYEQEAYLFLHRALNRIGKRKAKFKKEEAAIATLVFKILESYHNHLQKRFFTKKRLTTLVAIEGLENYLISTANDSANYLRINEAINRIVNMHLNTSPELLTFIADNIYYPKTKRFTVNIESTDFKLEKNVYTKTFRKKKLCKEEIITKRCNEFRQLADKYNVTPNDYRLALSVERR